MKRFIFLLSFFSSIAIIFLVTTTHKAYALGNQLSCPDEPAGLSQNSGLSQIDFTTQRLCGSGSSTGTAVTTSHPGFCLSERHDPGLSTVQSWFSGLGTVHKAGDGFFSKSDCIPSTYKGDWSAYCIVPLSSTNIDTRPADSGCFIPSIPNGSYCDRNSACTSLWCSNNVCSACSTNKDCPMNNCVNNACQGPVCGEKDGDPACINGTPCVSPLIVTHIAGQAMCSGNNGPTAAPTPTATPAPPPPPCVEVNGVCTSVQTGLGNILIDPAGAIANLFGILLSISGAIVIGIIIFSGYRLMMSQGNPEKIKEAREALTSAIIGLLFMIFSVAILRIIGVNILHIPGFQ